MDSFDTGQIAEPDSCAEQEQGIDYTDIPKITVFPVRSGFVITVEQPMSCASFNGRSWSEAARS